MCDLPGEPRRTASSPTSGQHGIALVTALVLLILVTLIAIAAIRGTTLQQRMTANFYDRSIAFQAAEAGLAAGAEMLTASPAVIARNCGPGGVSCRANPFEDPNLPAGSIQTVAAAQFDAGENAAGAPQYVVEHMGAYPDPESNTGFNQSANAAQYGAQGTSTTAIYYRITARSGDPDAIGERSVVVLQTMYKQ